MRQASPNAVLLDLGNLADTPEKYAVVLDAAKGLGYDALALAPLDLARCPELPALAGARGLAALLAAPEAPAQWLSPLWTKRLDSRSLGVLHVQTLLRQDPRALSGDPLGDVASAVQRARAECDFLVLISRMGLESDRKLLARADVSGSLDLVIEVEEALSHDAVTEVEGSPLLLPRRGGREVAQLDVDLSEGQPRYTLALHPVTKEAPLDEPTQRLMTAFLAEHGKEAPPSPVPPRSEWGYAPASKCVQCHEVEGASWAQSPHAAAVATLQAEGRLESPCLRCHSEYHRRNQATVALPKGEDGVQCATCHGDGIVHSLTGGKGPIVPQVPEQVCLDCHDQEHSPRFSYAACLPLVRHQ